MTKGNRASFCEADVQRSESRFCYASDLKIDLIKGLKEISCERDTPHYDINFENVASTGPPVKPEIKQTHFIGKTVLSK